MTTHLEEDKKIKRNGQGVVLRWQRNKMVRPLSSPHIHQKIIWMLSNFHRTTSECWRRTLGTQKGRLFSSKGGRTKYKWQKKKRRDKRVRDGDPSWGGSHEGEVSKKQETFHWQVGGEFWNLRGQYNQEEKKNPQNMHLTPTPSGKVAQMLTDRHQQAGAGQGGSGCMLR